MYFLTLNVPWQQQALQVLNFYQKLIQFFKIVLDTFFTTKLRIQCFLIMSTENLGQSLYDIWFLYFDIQPFYTKYFCKFSGESYIQVLFFLHSFWEQFAFRLIRAVLICTVCSCILYCLNPPMLYIGLLNRWIKHRLDVKST